MTSYLLGHMTQSSTKNKYCHVDKLGPLLTMKVSTQGTQLLTHNATKTGLEKHLYMNTHKRRTHMSNSMSKEQMFSHYDVHLSRKHPVNEASQVQRGCTHGMCAEPAQPWRQSDWWSQGCGKADADCWTDAGSTTCWS